MSEEGGFGIGLVEKFFGMLIFVIGILGLYYTLTSASILLMFTGFFSFLCVILMILGFVLLTAKTE